MRLRPISYLCLLFAFSLTLRAERPNVLLIICDDLNDYIETLGGHPQTHTPHIKRLIDSGVSFTQAHCNIPICNPSRASLFTGILPHNSQCFGFQHWDTNEVLKNSRTMMAHFRAHGYQALGTGKIMHNRDRQEWSEFGYASDYGPFTFDGEQDIPHPDTPKPFRDDFGIIDGSFGPLKNLSTQTAPDSNRPLSWRTGGWNKKRAFRYVNDDDRDHTGDELNAKWAIEKLKDLAKAEESKRQPFFMGVGFLRPHTPLIVPQKYFERFPLESLELPIIKSGDAEDTFKHTVLNESQDRGTEMINSLTTSYDGNRELALKHFVQAYLASVASIDDLVGQILDTLDASPLKDNTIVIFTSDHGWGNGEKNYLYKNSLWQESTRVPLVIRAPGVSRAGGTTALPVSLVDLYPTLLDLCNLPGDTMKNSQGRPLDGSSLTPLLKDPATKTWDGPDAALTALYKWANYYDPAQQSYSLRYEEWRYIRYENGHEELYHTADDPHEWTNLSPNPEYAERLKSYREQLLDMIPSKPQPAAPETSDADWKASYFKKFPQADTNNDGTLSWPELKNHKEKRSKSNTLAQKSRLQSTGVFSRNDKDHLIFTTTNQQVYYVIDSLKTKVQPYLDEPVSVVSNVKPGKNDQVMLMVHIISIKESK